MHIGSSDTLPEGYWIFHKYILLPECSLGIRIQQALTKNIFNDLTKNPFSNAQFLLSYNVIISPVAIEKVDKLITSKIKKKRGGEVEGMKNTFLGGQKTL